MGASDAPRGFAPSLLNLGSSMHPLWLQGWGFGCISVVFLVFFLLLQVKREPEGEGLPPVLF